MKFCPQCGQRLTGLHSEEKQWYATKSETRFKQNTTEQLTQYVAQSLAEGRDKGGLTKELVKQGWSKEMAAQFVGDIEQELKERAEEYKRTPEGRQVMASKYKRHMLYGILWAAGGLAVTIATYEAASEGGWFIVAWGAIIFGIYDFVRGLVEWLRYRD